MFLPMLASADANASNNAEQEDSLYGEWWLVGWNDGGIYFEVDTNIVSHRHLSIEIPRRGYVMAYSIVNEISLGLLTLNGNEMIFDGEKFMTEVYCDIMENQFFEDHICDIKSYLLEGNLLKLYYTDNDYFVFTSDLYNSEEHLYEWKNWQAGPYIGEVTAMSDAEVEVKTIESPAYAGHCSRIMPPTYDICHFERSDLTDQSFEVGDRIAFQIVQFKRLKVEKGRGYQLKVESCKGSRTVTDRTGTIHNDKRMGWTIIDDEVSDGKNGTYYYPLKNLAEEYLTEGQRVRFSGEVYPTILPPWDSVGFCDCYYLSIHTIAQTAYYYYKGKKVPLTLNEKKICVSIPKDCGDIIERFLANTPTLDKIRDELFEIYLIRRSDYNKLTMLDFWAEDTKSVILTSSYYTENNEEICTTPYLDVRLKKEEDVDLLTSYAEQYKLNIVRNSPLMPLWYILNITPESEMNTLECANALYESGDFAESVPDWAYDYKIEEPYRPFVEEGKVWKVGNCQAILDNFVQVVDYYYFDGDTIIGGKTCKQMMCQRFVSPDYSNEYWTPTPSLTKVGAWYEEDQKVYFYDERKQSMVIKYDFSLAANDTLQFLTDWSSPFIIGPKQTGGIEGFKGVYRDIRMCGDEGQSYHDTFWLEGVGCLRGPLSNPCDPILADPVPEFVMSCVVGDEVIYYNDEYEDGATPAGARKNRFDFTHTIKEKPKARIKQEESDACISSSERDVARPKVKARMRSEESQSLYGEYNERQLSIDLNPISDAYQVRITNESGKAVYEKIINAGSIVGLSIDISKYPEGNYTVTVENSNESFTGEFKAQLTGIEEVRSKKIEAKGHIYNLQGQRLSRLQKGLNIVNGRKIFVKD